MQLSRAKPGNPASSLHRRRNVTWVKLGIASIWELDSMLNRYATHIEPVIRYQKLSAQYRNQGRYM